MPCKLILRCIAVKKRNSVYLLLIAHAGVSISMANQARIHFQLQIRNRTPNTLAHS